MKGLKDSALSLLSNLNFVETGKEISKIGKNLSKLAKALLKVKSLVALLPETATNITMMGVKLPEILKNAKEMG